MNRWILLAAGSALVFCLGFAAALWYGGSAQKEVNPSLAGFPSAGRSAKLPDIKDLPNPFSASSPPVGFSTTAAVDSAQQGDLLFEQRRFREAIPFYRKAVEKNSGDVDSWNDLGLCLHYVGRNREALEVLKKGSSIKPRFQRIWLSIGFVSLHLNLKEDAKSAFERAISLNSINDVAKEARKFLERIR